MRYLSADERRALGVDEQSGVLYHVSPTSNRESIRRFGILRGDGVVFSQPEWSTGKVFLSTDLGSAIEWMDHIYETTWQDVALFPVRLTSDLLSRLEADVKAAQDGIRGAVFLRHDIPASRVGEPLFSGPGSAAADMPGPELPRVRAVPRAPARAETRVASAARVSTPVRRRP